MRVKLNQMHQEDRKKKSEFARKVNDRQSTKGLMMVNHPLSSTSSWPARDLMPFIADGRIRILI